MKNNEESRFSHDGSALRSFLLLTATAPLGIALSACSNEGVPREPVAQVEQTLPASWASTGSLATVREYVQHVVLPNGNVLVTGGGNGETQDTELYDPSEGTWSAGPKMAVARG